MDCWRFFCRRSCIRCWKSCTWIKADYLAIATLLISEIVIAIVKHEDWLSRGVKNVIGLKRPVPYEIDFKNTQWFINIVNLILES